jgi:hypothetical protein
MTENSALIGPRPGADNLRSASAADGDASGLKNAISGRNLRLAEASIWRISVYDRKNDGEAIAINARRGR